jgi:hypothetical protein
MNIWQRTAVCALLLTTACAGQTDRVAQNPSASAEGSDNASSTTSASCVESYSLDALNKRDYAFDGTVARIERAQSDEEAADADSVTFEVKKWFKGGSGPTAVRRAYGFTAIPSVGGSPHQVGQRLLVAGDEDFVWECGFTQPYDAEVAADWEQAL